ncbi:MAG: hypothetical protein ACJ74Y_14220 [Bryobacteraceae bacterium]|jgi:uncharacterized protein (DUF169 family)
MKKTLNQGATMNRIVQKAASSTKKFVIKHKTALAVTATAALGLALNKSALKAHDDFLKEHDLYEEFYTPSDEE